jgi:hypothetical protein
MYGLPENTDLSFFKGLPLLQVCFGEHDLILRFDNDVGVTITSSIGVLRGSDGCECTSEFRKAAPSLLSLLNHVVTDVTGETSGTLTLFFEGDIRIVVLDDSADYESYVINFRNQVIVV